MNRMIDWFGNSDLGKRHRAAYETSLNSDHAIKVHSGMYYYKGFQIDHSEERATGLQWAYAPFDKFLTSCEFAATKKQCMICIDTFIADGLEW